jgi:hypothetical protein
VSVNVDLLEVAYCEGWDSAAGAMAGPLSTALAEERDRDGEQYAVLLSAFSGPIALIEVARADLHYGLRVFGPGAHVVSEVDCRLLERTRLFMMEQRLEPLPDDARIAGGQAWRRVVSAELGYVQEREEIGGGLRVTHGPADTSGYWVDAPDFGDWARFVHSFPVALEVAGLDVPVTAVLFDVSPPDGAGLPFDERPWQPSKALAPDPAHLDRLFAAGTRLAYEVSGGLDGPGGFDGFDGGGGLDGGGGGGGGGFGGGRTTRVSVSVMKAGKLRMPSGHVVAKDPTWVARVDAFTVAVPPGEYPLLLSVVRFADRASDTRVAAAKLVIRDEAAQTWEMALLPGQDPRLLGNGEFYGFGVDAGMACFYDDAAAEAFDTIMDDSYDLLGPKLTGSVSDRESGANLIAYASGWGDGSYPTWIGRDGSGNVTCFVSDMLVMPGDVTVEEGP